MGSKSKRDAASRGDDLWGLTINGEEPPAMVQDSHGTQRDSPSASSGSVAERTNPAMCARTSRKLERASSRAALKALEVSKI